MSESKPFNQTSQQLAPHHKSFAPPSKPRSYVQEQIERQQAAALVPPPISASSPTSTSDHFSGIRDQPAPTVTKPQAAKRNSLLMIQLGFDADDSENTVSPSSNGRTPIKPAIAPRPTPAATKPELPKESNQGIGGSSTENKPPIKAKPSAQNEGAARRGPTIIRPNAFNVALRPTAGVADKSQTGPASLAKPTVAWPALKPVGSADKLLGQADSAKDMAFRPTERDVGHGGSVKPVMGAAGTASLGNISGGGRAGWETFGDDSAPTKLQGVAVEKPKSQKRPTIIYPQGSAASGGMAGSAGGTYGAVGSGGMRNSGQKLTSGVGVPDLWGEADKTVSAETKNDRSWTKSQSFGGNATQIYVLDPASNSVPRPNDPLVKKQPPSKPPPPRLTPVAEVKPYSFQTRSNSTGSLNRQGGRSGVPPPRPPAANQNRPQAEPGKQASGMAPALPHRPWLGHPLFHYVATDPHALALYDYSSTQPEDLSFLAGDVILLSRWVDSDWLEGKTERGRGIFPASFVDIIIPLPAGNNTQKGAAASRAASACPTSTSQASMTGPRCQARFDYEGGEEGDLRFSAGEVIRLVERVNDEWLKGEVKGHVGMFPRAFVEIVEDLPTGSTVEMKGRGNRVTALHEFRGEPDELFFQAGATLTVLSEVDADWLYGELNGSRGRFPKSFVDRVPAGLTRFVKEQKQAENKPGVLGRLSSHGSEAYCVAIYDYTGDTVDDLSFVAGERITLFAHEGPDWLRGTANGRKGMFPAAFVNIVKDVDDLPARPQHIGIQRDSGSIMGHYAQKIHTASVLSSTAPNHALPGTKLQTSLVGSALAMFDFDGDSADDLPFRAGETIEVTEMVGADWMRGRIDGRTGMFPAAFVQMIVPLQR